MIKLSVVGYFIRSKETYCYDTLQKWTSAMTKFPGVPDSCGWILNDGCFVTVNQETPAMLINRYGEDVEIVSPDGTMFFDKIGVEIREEGTTYKPSHSLWEELL